VLPLENESEVQKARETHPDFCIPEGAKTGVAACAEIIKKLKTMDGVRGVHLLAGGKEAMVPEILAAAGL
jgi:hypothetical protein